MTETSLADVLPDTMELPTGLLADLSAWFEGTNGTGEGIRRILESYSTPPARIDPIIPSHPATTDKDTRAVRYSLDPSRAGSNSAPYSLLGTLYSGRNAGSLSGPY